VGRVPPGPARVQANADHALFTAQYERVVAGARPDVALANEKLCRSSWFLRALRRQAPGLFIPYLDDGGRLDRIAGRLVEENVRVGVPVSGETPDTDGAHGAPGPGLTYTYSPGPAPGPAPAPPVYAGEIGRRIGREAGMLRASWELAHARFSDAARAAGLPDDPAFATIPPDTKLLQDLLPRATPIFIFEDWQADLLARDLHFAAYHQASGPPGPDAPEEVRLLNTWHLLLSERPIPELSPREHVATARMLLSRGLTDSAVAQLIDLTSDEEAVLLLAAIEGNRGNLDRAAELLAAFPKSPRALAQLGLVRAKQGRLDEAAELWRRSLALDPDQPEVAAWLRSIPTR
jgi:hypothetical protein